MTRIFTFMAALLLSTSAYAQTQPTTSQSSGTVTVTDTFQQVLASAVNVGGVRRGCTIQNQGAASMYVFFGPIASATKTASFVIQPAQSTPAVQGGTIACQLGGSFVAQDQVSITGTQTQSFVYSEQK